MNALTKFTPYGERMIIQIDKKAQNEKNKVSTVIKGFVLPDAYKYMLYNLQYGKILAVSKDCEKDCPEVKVGRIAILHHKIESSDTTNKLLETLPNGDEIYWVSTMISQSGFEYFGVFDEENNIIPAHQWFFAEAKDYAMDEGEYEEVDFKGTKVRTILDDYADGRKVKLKRKGSLYLIDEKEKEAKSEIFKTCKVLFSPAKETVILPGDMLLTEGFAHYPINLFGKDYWILHKEFIIAKLPQQK